MEKKLAHSSNFEGDTHPLITHLKKVAHLARTFAKKFNCEEMGWWAGWLHDVGKAAGKWQELLNTGHKLPPHAIAGAYLAFHQNLPKEIVWAIAGHHGGLASRSELKKQLYNAGKDELVAEAIEWAQRHILPKAGNLPQARGLHPKPRELKRMEMRVRMVASALVDADYLDTESHFCPAQAATRGRFPPLEELWERLLADQRRLLGSMPTPVGRWRDRLWEWAVSAATKPPGLFSLNAPTGAGKTRAVMGFALKHALVHGMQRVVVALPFTSLIEQTAGVYRKILGEEAVVEHHCAALDPEALGIAEPTATALALATHNWDAPVIITTFVQLLEGLLANRPSRIRRLHNLVKSVIVLDEAQAIPPPLLKPTCEVLAQLIEEYGTTIVLSSATQPAITSPELELTMPPIREIVQQPYEFFEALRRVRFEVELDPVDWASVAEAVQRQHQVLVVLNTIADAQNLYRMLSGDGIFHLSGAMCPAHRTQVLQTVHQRLKSGEKCLVVATQVVEAGVDIDFAVVMRAAGPLESVVQAAGRCNREGRRREGKVIIFTPTESKLPGGTYKTATMEFINLLQYYPEFDLQDPKVCQRYFHLLYQNVDLDNYHVINARERLDFPKVAEAYRLVRDSGIEVVVPWAEAQRILAELQGIPIEKLGPGARRRRLQRFSVSIREKKFKDLLRRGIVEIREDALAIWRGTYHPSLGIVDEEASYDPAALVVK